MTAKPAKKKTGKKRKPGQPTKYRKTMCAKAVAAYQDGKNNNQVMLVLGISRKTFYDWINKHPDFEAAVEIGRLHAEDHWIELMKENILLTAGPGGQKFNTSGWIFYMKNNFRWKDQRAVELSGPGGGPLELDEWASLTDEEREGKLKATYSRLLRMKGEA